MAAREDNHQSSQPEHSHNAAACCAALMNWGKVRNRDMRTARFIALVLLIQWGFCASAHAQPRGRVTYRPRAADRPTISPYIDLVNQGNNNTGVGFQYFRRVRPDVEFRQAENNLRQNLKSLSKSVNESKTQSESSMLGTTGHAASFMTHGKYFNIGARSGGR